jgi:hypothetical protein
VIAGGDVTMLDSYLDKQRQEIQSVRLKTNKMINNEHRMEQSFSIFAVSQQKRRTWVRLGRACDPYSGCVGTVDSVEFESLRSDEVVDVEIEDDKGLCSARIRDLASMQSSEPDIVRNVKGKMSLDSLDRLVTGMTREGMHFARKHLSQGETILITNQDRPEKNEREDASDQHHLEVPRISLPTAAIAVLTWSGQTSDLSSVDLRDSDKLIEALWPNSSFTLDPERFQNGSHDLEDKPVLLDALDRLELDLADVEVTFCNQFYIFLQPEQAVSLICLPMKRLEHTASACRTLLLAAQTIKEGSSAVMHDCWRLMSLYIATRIDTLLKGVSIRGKFNMPLKVFGMAVKLDEDQIYHEWRLGGMYVSWHRSVLPSFVTPWFDVDHGILREDWITEMDFTDWLRSGSRFLPYQCHKLIYSSEQNRTHILAMILARQSARRGQSMNEEMILDSTFDWMLVFRNVMVNATSILVDAFKHVQGRSKKNASLQMSGAIALVADRLMAALMLVPGCKALKAFTHGSLVRLNGASVFESATVFLFCQESMTNADDVASSLNQVFADRLPDELAELLNLIQPSQIAAARAANLNAECMGVDVVQFLGSKGKVLNPSLHWTHWKRNRQNNRYQTINTLYCFMGNYCFTPI